MLHLHTVKTVEAVVCPQPDETFRVFINSIHQQTGKAVGHNDITKHIGLCLQVFPANPTHYYKNQIFNRAFHLPTGFIILNM